LTQEEPYSDMDGASTILAVAEGKRLQVPEDVPDELRALLQRCWDKNPDNRPSMEESVKLLKQLAGERIQTDYIEISPEESLSASSGNYNNTFASKNISSSTSSDTEYHNVSTSRQENVYIVPTVDMSTRRG
jgi:hypothetical protein